MHSINKNILLKDRMLISVLIPCYNEKNTIEEIVNRINELEKLNLEIIIIYQQYSKEMIYKEMINLVILEVYIFLWDLWQKLRWVLEIASLHI